MGAASRRKGASGERELAALIRDMTGWDVRRRCRQHDGDSDLEGAPGWSVEVKRRARVLRSDVAAWWRQAVEQAQANEQPVLFFRADRDEWRAVWPLGLHLHTDWRGYAMTVEGSVEAWAAVARELVADLALERNTGSTVALPVRRGSGIEATGATATTS
jgi:hypothetical protein